MSRSALGDCGRGSGEIFELGGQMLVILALLDEKMKRPPGRRMRRTSLRQRPRSSSVRIESMPLNEKTATSKLAFSNSHKSVASPQRKSVCGNFFRHDSIID